MFIDGREIRSKLHRADSISETKRLLRGRNPKQKDFRKKQIRIKVSKKISKSETKICKKEKNPKLFRITKTCPPPPSIGLKMQWPIFRTKQFLISCLN